MKRATAEIKGKDLVIHLSEPLNMDHIETVTGNTDRFWVDYDVADTRRLTDKQRRLFFALMGDIGRWSGEEPEWLRKYYFYPKFAERMLEPVSLSDQTDNSVTDGTVLIDMVGAGVNRNHVDHTKRHVLALCRGHHGEIEQIGPSAFSRKYHVPVTGIKLDVETLRKIGVRGDYTNETKENSHD